MKYLKVFAFVLVGAFLATFLVGFTSSTVMSVEKRIERGELTIVSDASDQRFHAVYSCGTHNNYLVYDIDEGNVLRSDYQSGAPQEFVAHLLETHGASLGGALGGAGLGYKYKDIISHELSSKSPHQSRSGRYRIALSAIVAAFTGYGIGERVAEETGLHCYTAANSRWLENVDWQLVATNLYTERYFAWVTCARDLEDRLSESGRRVESVFVQSHLLEMSPEDTRTGETRDDAQGSTSVVDVLKPPEAFVNLISFLSEPNPELVTVSERTSGDFRSLTSALKECHEAKALIGPVLPSDEVNGSTME